MNFLLFSRLLKESFRVALSSLWANKLRTMLSLLGITIGIFAIILVYSAVDSLESNIRNSFKSLGDNVVYVQRHPWNGGGGKWWKMIQWPEPQYEEFRKLESRLPSAKAMSFVYGLSKTVKYRNNSVEYVKTLGVSHQYNNVWGLEFDQGRYFTEGESNSGRPLAILGYDVAQGLFQNQNPIGKSVKLMGRKLTVVAVLAKEGQSLVGNNNDVSIIVPAHFLMKLVNPKYLGGNTIMVKAKDGVDVEQLKDELLLNMRQVRRLKPKADINFALNQVSIIADGLDQIFGVVGFAGTVIGLFSILVGGFGIANIMFVSVKERTGQVGIQKSLGAKKSFILFQFIFEAIVLCLIGGLFGLLLVYLLTFLVSHFSDFEIFLSIGNIMLGITLSILIGLLSGILPAYRASVMDPVYAIRFNG